MQLRQLDAVIVMLSLPGGPRSCRFALLSMRSARHVRASTERSISAPISAMFSHNLCFGVS